MRFSNLIYWKIQRIINSYKAAIILRYPSIDSVTPSVKASVIGRV